MRRASGRERIRLQRWHTGFESPKTLTPAVLCSLRRTPKLNRCANGARRLGAEVARSGRQPHYRHGLSGRQCFVVGPYLARPGAAAAHGHGPHTRAVGQHAQGRRAFVQHRDERRAVPARAGRGAPRCEVHVGDLAGRLAHEVSDHCASATAPATPPHLARRRYGRSPVIAPTGPCLPRPTTRRTAEARSLPAPRRASSD